MEASFVEFEGADGDVRVNASNVQWIQKRGRRITGDHALIMFGPGHSLAVKGTVEQVTKKLIGKRST